MQEDSNSNDLRDTIRLKNRSKQINPKYSIVSIKNSEIKPNHPSPKYSQRQIILQKGFDDESNIKSLHLARRTNSSII